MDKFFEDVEDVKEDMRSVEMLYRKLQEANEERKMAKAMKEIQARMDKDVELVLKRVKVVKGKLEALKRSNTANRSLSGCGPGSSADRTRTSVVSGLGKKLKDMVAGARNKKSLYGFGSFATETKLLVSSQYVSGLKPRQNDENNRGQKPLLH